MFPVLLSGVFAWLFYVSSAGRIIASFIGITVRGEERRTKAQPIGYIDEPPEERIKVPPADAVVEPPRPERERSSLQEIQIRSGQVAIGGDQ